MLTDLAHRLQEKIKEEKEEREQCEEALLRLLEETIEKCDTEGNTVPANPAKWLLTFEALIWKIYW